MGSTFVCWPSMGCIFVCKNYDAISIYIFLFCRFEGVDIRTFIIFSEYCLGKIGSAFENFKFSNLSCDDMP